MDRKERNRLAAARYREKHREEIRRKQREHARALRRNETPDQRAERLNHERARRKQRPPGYDAEQSRRRRQKDPEKSREYMRVYMRERRRKDFRGLVERLVNRDPGRPLPLTNHQQKELIRERLRTADRPAAVILDPQPEPRRPGIRPRPQFKGTTQRLGVLVDPGLRDRDGKPLLGRRRAPYRRKMPEVWQVPRRVYRAGADRDGG